MRYADVVFASLGHLVTRWFTLNEPLTHAVNGWSNGIYAPGRCSRCSHGDSATEPYLVGHHMLLAHAAAVKVSGPCVASRSALNAPAQPEGGRSRLAV